MIPVCASRGSDRGAASLPIHGTHCNPPEPDPKWDRTGDARPAAGVRPRLLIVHPRRHVCDVLSTIIRPLRLDCAHADGEHSFRERIGQAFSLVLIAIDPSDPEAWVLLAHARRERPWLPVIMLFTTPHEGWARKALWLGARAVLNYPCEPNELRGVVSDALRAPQPLSVVGAGPERMPASVEGNEPEPEPSDGSIGKTLKENLELYERLLIVRALRLLDGNRRETARVLGIDRTTLYHKMRKHRLI
jgi:DNA-binding NtrC family response regulator